IGGTFQFGHALGGVHAIDGGTRAGHGVIRRRCVTGSGYFSLGGLPDGGCSSIRFCSRWRRCNRFLFFDRTRSLLRRRCDCSVVPDNRFFFRMEFIPVQHDVLLVFIAGVMAPARLTNSMCLYPVLARVPVRPARASLSYWQASQSGLSIEQAFGTSAAWLNSAVSSTFEETRFRRPSLMVDFSAVVAPMARR